jgi:hypothetical protein
VLRLFIGLVAIEGAKPEMVKESKHTQTVQTGKHSPHKELLGIRDLFLPENPTADYTDLSTLRNI